MIVQLYHLIVYSTNDDCVARVRMIQASITRSVPAEDAATSQAELARLRAEYEAELGVWRGKYQQAEVDRENCSSFEKVKRCAFNLFAH